MLFISETSRFRCASSSRLDCRGCGIFNIRTILYIYTTHCSVIHIFKHSFSLVSNTPPSAVAPDFSHGDRKVSPGTTKSAATAEVTTESCIRVGKLHIRREGPPAAAYSQVSSSD